MTSSNRRVVITGIGLITPLGLSTNDSWNNIIAGKSGISKLDTFPEWFPSRVAGIVPNLDNKISNLLPSSKLRKIDRFTQLAFLAAIEAFNQAQGNSLFPDERTKIGIYLGVGIGGLTTISEGVRSYDRGGIKSISPFLLTRAIANEAPGFISMELNLQGPMLAFSNACASGADAIGHAYYAIKSGAADCMLAGGTESCINELSLSSFGNMKTLSTWKGDPEFSSRPFSHDRCGFVIAEGAGVLMLELEEQARARGVPILAEIVSYAATADAFHIAAIHPEGRGVVQALSQALKTARLNPSDIGYINAHGTATQMNDVIETKALKTVFKSALVPSHGKKHTVISSTKSMTGHMLGATGAIEVGFSALALQNQCAPPTINLDEPDPECDLDYIPHTARSLSINYALSNSFGFGGGNAVLILKKPD